MLVIKSEKHFDQFPPPKELADFSFILFNSLWADSPCVCI